jgi:hypothetical protein
MPFSFRMVIQFSAEPVQRSKLEQIAAPRRVKENSDSTPRLLAPWSGFRRSSRLRCDVDGEAVLLSVDGIYDFKACTAASTTKKSPFTPSTCRLSDGDDIRKLSGAAANRIGSR